VGGALLACSGGGAGDNEPIRVHATVIRPTTDTIRRADTIRLALPATAHACDDGRSLLLQSVSAIGNGMLVRLIYGDSLVSGDYRVVTAGESATRGAQVAVRYMVGAVTHSFVVDSGSVAVRRGRRELDARGSGSGIEAGIRTRVAVEYADVPVTADTVRCRSEP
jgi:hypothetical protein